MAKGRFISKEISLDKRVNELSDGFSMVGFTWLITHADREGRTYGDPAIVKSLIFPRRPDITIEMVAGYIQEWADSGLIILYESGCDAYIEFPNFEKHQIGLRKERESPSSIPINSGLNPSNDGKNRVNVKLSKVNVKVNINNSAKTPAETDPSYEDCTPDGEPVVEKKKKKPKDERSMSPAIISFRRLTGLYPPKVNYEQVISVLGDQPDEAKMKKCYQDWCGRGFKPTNINWLLDWYVNGVPVRGKPTYGKPIGLDAVNAELARLEQEENNG